MSSTSVHNRAAAALMALAIGAGGCRAHQGGDLPAVPPDKDKPAAGADAGDDGDGGSGPLGGAGDGPKLMGYEYPFRLSYGPITSKYHDTENNQASHRKTSVGVGMKGSRYVLEHYPVVRDNFPHSDYGYAVAEFRNEKPAADYWVTRQTAVLLMGYILPVHRLIAPVVGIHWEFNKVNLGLDDSPEVAKTDIRALLVGVDARQKIWGLGQWFALFYGLKLHLLNPAQKSTGFEGEASLGGTMQFEFVRLDFTVGYLEQRYDGEREDPNNLGHLGIQSRTQSTYAMVTLWI